MNIFTWIHKHWATAVWKMRGLIVYALVGKSGTGKSFRARLIADKYQIDAIIDDGLLIHKEQIIAGKSAKRENAYLAAVKTALFTDKAHLKEVRAALEKAKLKRVLLLGTSDKMIGKICNTLQIPDPIKVIRIEDIATADEIDTAIRYRKHHGKHVIPVPAIEVKRNYPKIVADSLKVWLDRGMGLFRKKEMYEKTVVRPEFSNKGAVTISESALTQMVMHCVLEKSPELTVTRITVKEDSPGYKLNVSLSVPFGLELNNLIHGLHGYIIDKVEKYTGIMIDELHLTIDNVKV